MRALGDPDAFPASDLGVQLAAKQLGLPADTPPAHRTQCAVEALAGLRDPTSVDRARPRRQQLAATGDPEGEVKMETLHVRTVDSPVGPLTLAGKDGRLRHLRMVDQTYEPSREGWDAG